MNEWWLLVLFAVFMIGLTKSGFGSGIGLLIVPMMVIAMTHIPGRGEKAALGFMLPLLIVGDLIAVWQYRRQFSVAHVQALFPGTIGGVVVGALLLWWFEKQHAEMTSALVRLEIGFECVLLVGLHFWRVWRGVDRLFRPRPWQSLLTGTFAGASSTIAHAAGPIVALYLLPQKLDRRTYVGTTAMYFFLLNTAKLPAYAMSGAFADASPASTLIFAPLVLIGAVFGRWINRRLSDKAFSNIVYGATFVLGIYLLIDATTRLRHLL